MKYAIIITCQYFSRSELGGRLKPKGVFKFKIENVDSSLRMYSFKHIQNTIKKLLVSRNNKMEEFSYVSHEWVDNQMNELCSGFEFEQYLNKSYQESEK